jgi:hypothetical protein
VTVKILIGAASVAIYFSVLAYAFFAVGKRTFSSYLKLFKSLKKGDGRARRGIIFATVFMLIALIAGLSTWYYIIRFFDWTFSTVASGSWQLWISESDLFIQAYRLVSKTPQHWFWSSQLLIATCAFVSILKSAGGRPAWRFALLGFLGAISVAFALFLADWVCREQISKSGIDSTLSTNMSDVGPSPLHTIGPVLGFSIILAMASIVLSPLLSTSSLAYIVNLIFLHIILLIALMPEPKRLGIKKTQLPQWLGSVAIFALLYLLLQIGRIFVTSSAAELNSFGQTLVAAIFENDCQTSITLDLFFVLGSAAAFFAYRTAEPHFSKELPHGQL